MKTIHPAQDTSQEREYSNRQVLLSLANSIQERDIVTYEHSRRVATYAQRLARHLGWSRRDARDLALASLVHDLGKTWIGNDILLKSEALSDEERRTIERHPVIGARILIGCDVHPFYVETILYHHEAWDGHGYPTGLRGEEIPLSARILTVADVYDVLTSQRPYSAPISQEAARERILLGSARSFDPTIVRAFVHLLDAQPNFTLPERFCALPTRPSASNSHVGRKSPRLPTHMPAGSLEDFLPSADSLPPERPSARHTHPGIDAQDASTSALRIINQNTFLARL